MSFLTGPDEDNFVSGKILDCFLASPSRAKVRVASSENAAQRDSSQNGSRVHSHVYFKFMPGKNVYDCF